MIEMAVMIELKLDQVNVIPKRLSESRSAIYVGSGNTISEAAADALEKYAAAFRGNPK